MANSNSTTIQLSDRGPAKFKQRKPSQQVQIRSLRRYRERKCSELLQTSNFPKQTRFSSNGFVFTVFHADNRHHNLILRPDDVWVAILTQFSFFINEHAEDFRGKFVDFEGTKTLTVCLPERLRTVPHDLFVKLLSKGIDRHLVDSEMKKWILSSFSTTTDNDLVTAGVLFMSSMKKTYHGDGLPCSNGIQNITLEGTSEVWKDIHARLEKLKEYKLAEWYDMLEPILKQFVNAKEGNIDLDFWSKICHLQPGGSGLWSLTGWITAFCVLNEKGYCELKESRGINADDSGKKWFRVSTNKIPTGIVEVDLLIDDGVVYKTVMFAGLMAAEIKKDKRTLQPTMGWAIALISDSDNDCEDKASDNFEDEHNVEDIEDTGHTDTNNAEDPHGGDDVEDTDGSGVYEDSDIDDDFKSHFNLQQWKLSCTDPEINLS